MGCEKERKGNKRKEKMENTMMMRDREGDRTNTKGKGKKAGSAKTNQSIPTVRLQGTGCCVPCPVDPLIDLI